MRVDAFRLILQLSAAKFSLLSRQQLHQNPQAFLVPAQFPCAVFISFETTPDFHEQRAPLLIRCVRRFHFSATLWIVILSAAAFCWRRAFKPCVSGVFMVSSALRYSRKSGKVVIYCGIVHDFSRRVGSLPSIIIRGWHKHTIGVPVRWLAQRALAVIQTWLWPAR